MLSQSQASDTSNGSYPVAEEVHDPEKGSADEKESADESGAITAELSEESGQQKLDFPEGGLDGWLTLVGAVLAQYATFGYTNSFGVYQDFYVREYLNDFTPSSIGWIGGIQIFLTFSMGIFTGRAFDRGYFKHLMVASTLLQALALFTLSVSQTNKYYQVFLAHGLCLGLSCGAGYLPALGIVSHYFHRRRSLAMGIASSGSALGAFLHPIMLNKLINGPVGFHNGVRISGALNVSLLVMATLLMRSRLPPKQGETGKHFPIIEFLKDRAYFIFLLGGIFAFSGIFFSVFYIQLYAVVHGVDKNLSFYVISILNAASIFGRTIPGALAPRFGLFNLLMIVSTSLGITVITMSAVKDAAGTVVFAIFYGFFSGATIALITPGIALLSRDVNEIGTRMGIYFLFGGFTGLFAIPISGALLTNRYHWVHAILYSGLCLLIAGLFNAITGFIVIKRRKAAERQL